MTTSTSKPMSLVRLAELLDTYGGEPSRWPAQERELAVSLLATSPEAVELQRAALLLDQQLDQFEVPDASTHLQARVLEIPIRAQRAQRARFTLPGWAIAGLALLPCALGFISGTISSSDPEDEWSEVASLTLLGDLSEDDWP